MKIVELETGFTELIADEEKLIISKSTHFDEEVQEEVPDVIGKIIYLGKNDSVDNYIEIDEEIEE